MNTSLIKDTSFIEKRKENIAVWREETKEIEDLERVSLFDYFFQLEEMTTSQRQAIALIDKKGKDRT